MLLSSCLIPDGEHGSESEDIECDLVVAAAEWDYVESYYIIAAFLFCSALLKIGMFVHSGPSFHCTSC